MVEISDLLITAGVPTAITGMFVWLLQRRIKKRDDAQLRAQLETKEELEKQRKQHKEAAENQELYNLMILDSLQANEVLTIATAKAVQRIPDAHCNGDMHEALDYIASVGKNRKEFLQKQAIKNIYG